MKILIVADEESPYLWDHYRPGMLSGIDLILSAGDLKPEYLSFLVTMASCPLLFVHGNHDGNYDRYPPEGCECIEDKIVTVNGIRILGLGGAKKYNGGPYQYSEREMKRRITKLKWKLWRSGGFDILLTHSSVRGCGDADDIAHQGFEAFFPLLEKYQPAYLIHGHVHKSYGHELTRELPCGQTKVINGTGRYVIEI